MRRMQVESELVSWVPDYLTARPQYVRFQECVLCHTRAVLELVCIHLTFNSTQTPVFFRNTDSAIVGCIREGHEEEYRSTIRDFVGWCNKNHLRLNISKTKEIIIEFKRTRSKPDPVSIQGTDVDLVSNYKYLGVQLDNKLDWSSHIETVYKRGSKQAVFF